MVMGKAFDLLVRQFTMADGIALGWFLFCWVAYGLFAERSGHARSKLAALTDRYRLEWARQIISRESRIMDPPLVGVMVSSVSFYANTTIYIIAALMAVLGTLDKVIKLAADLPFGETVGQDLTEAKILLLLAVFVIAYFKITWSLRQYNLLAVLIGAAPQASAPAETREKFAQKIAAVCSSAGNEFNRGIRAYYFGVAALSWFIQPWLFVLSTTIVVIVMYRRNADRNLVKILSD
jgi:uncharacterized membrane protein